MLYELAEKQQGNCFISGVLRIFSVLLEASL